MHASYSFIYIQLSLVTKSKCLLILTVLALHSRGGFCDEIVAYEQPESFPYAVMHGIIYGNKLTEVKRTRGWTGGLSKMEQDPQPHI